MPSADGLAFQPLTAQRWADLEALFGPERGADSGCWCMWWHTTRKQWEAMGKVRRKAAFRKLVASNAVPGILAYDGSAPVGWCAIAPRATTPSLERSRVAKPLDDQPVWSITCFYIARIHRKRGLMACVVLALPCSTCPIVPLVTIDKYNLYHHTPGLNTYPLEPARALDRGEGFVGIAAAFVECGFTEVARRTPTCPVMRRAAAI